MVYLKAVRNKDVTVRVKGSELAAFTAHPPALTEANSVQ